MTKNELISKVYDELKGLGLTHFQVKSVIEHTFHDIYKYTAAEGKVNIGAFVFKKKERAARKGVNPKTGESIEVAASSAIVCRVKL